MISIVKDNPDKIIDACKEHQVKSLYLFGSAARAVDFGVESDADLLYEFKKNIPANIFADNYFDLHFKLENLLKRKIDLVPADKSKNKYFIQNIEADKIKLYEA